MHIEPGVYLLVAIMGAIIGSFLNVVIYRLPIIIGVENEIAEKKLSLSLPASRCTHCQHKLKWWHNVPIFSYILLKGKCAFCHEKISIQYLSVELISVIASVGSFYLFDNYYQAMISCVFVWLLLPLIWIDAKYQILPDEITIFGVWLGLLSNSLSEFGFDGFVTLEISVFATIFGYLFLWTIRYFFLIVKKQETLGLGDCKMLAMVGAFLGLNGVVYSIMFASFIGICAFLMLSIKDKHFDMSKKIPFGPFIAIGSLIILWLRVY